MLLLCASLFLVYNGSFTGASRDANDTRIRQHEQLRRPTEASVRVAKPHPPALQGYSGIIDHKVNRCGLMPGKRRVCLYVGSRKKKSPLKVKPGVFPLHLSLHRILNHTHPFPLLSNDQQASILTALQREQEPPSCHLSQFSPAQCCATLNTHLSLLITA